MAPALPRADEIISSAKIDLLSSHFFEATLAPVAEEVRRYEEAMKAEIEPLFSDSANEKTKLVIDTVTGLYEDLFDIARSGGANDKTLVTIYNFIENGMTKLVHEFSGYFDDDIKDCEVFTSLFQTRKNEAIWSEVFTFYFKSSTLSNAPPSLAADFVNRFWDCYLLDRPSGQPAPYYEYRLSKILDEKIYGAQTIDGDGTKHYDTGYIALFEQYSRAIAEKSTPERKSEILGALDYRGHEHAR